MILVRHGEIYTKSEPVRKQFIRKLVQNIQIALPHDNVVSRRWRILIYTKNEKKAVERLKHVFGIVSFSVATEINADMEKIKTESLKLTKHSKAKTFAMKTHRLTKEYEKTSQQINVEIGDFIRKNAKLKVNLDKPDLAINIEIYGNMAYIFSNTNTYKGPRGLPLGVSGCAELMPGKEKELAAWLIMKRGCTILKLPKSLEKWNYTQKGAKKKALFKISGETDLKKFIKMYKKDKLVFAPLIGMDKEYKSHLLTLLD